MWVEGGKSGSSGGTTIEYVGQFNANSGHTSATTINLASGTYARADYAELTTDNFIVLPVRSSSYKTASTSWMKGSTNDGWFASAYMANKNHEYTPSSGTFKFYGGFQAEHFYRTISKGTANGSVSYKVYIVKPGLSTFES